MKTKLKVELERILTKPNEDFGICYQLKSGVLEELFKDIAIGWPKHSGRHAYPIPCTAEGVHDHDLQFWDYPKWEGEQLELRIELIKYVLGVLT